MLNTFYIHQKPTLAAHADVARVNMNTDNLVRVPLDESKMVTVFCPEQDSFP